MVQSFRGADAGHTQSDYLALELGSVKSEPAFVHVRGDCDVLP
jgi:hypothetical protein